MSRRGIIWLAILAAYGLVGWLFVQVAQRWML